MEWAFDSGTPTGARFVLVVLADHAGEHKGEPWKCYPSMELIQEKTGQSIKTIERHLEWLAINGWLTRKPRPGRRRADGLYDYVLNRAKGPQPSDKLSDGQEGQSPDKLSDGQGRSSDNLDTTIRQFGGQPSDNLGNPPDPLIEINHQLTVSEPARAAARTDTHDGGKCDPVTLAAFARLQAAWSAVSPGRVAPKPSLRAFVKAAQLVAPERIADAGERYLAQDPDVRQFGAMRLHVWLDEGRFEPWLLAGDRAAAVGSAGNGVWSGPPEIRAAIAGAKGEAWAASYLDPAGWDGDGRVVLARTGMAERELSALARTLGGDDFTVARAGQ